MPTDRTPSSSGRSARRHDRRTPEGFTVSCYRVEEGRSIRGRRNLAIAVLDVSSGGARLGVIEAVEKGTVLTVEIRETATNDLFHARGVVRWVETATVEGEQRITIGVKWDEIFTAIGKRDKFLAGGAQGKAEPVRDRYPSDRARPAPTAAPPWEAAAPEEHFAVHDYTATLTKSGFMGIGRSRNLLASVSSLNAEGAQVLATEKLAVGTAVKFTLHLTKFADTLEAGGQVVWSKEPAAGATGHPTGIVFGALSPAQRKLLEYMTSWFTSYQAKYRQGRR